MKMPFDRARLVTAGGLVLAGTVLIADGTRFSDYTPLASSAGPVAVIDEDQPITFGNPDFEQHSIVVETGQLAANKPNSGNFDMITVNETGPHKGRYLFTVFETGSSGVQRHDLETGTTDTIWQTTGGSGGHVVVRRVLLDAVGHADHRRGIVGNGGGGIRPARTAVSSS